MRRVWDKQAHMCVVVGRAVDVCQLQLLGRGGRGRAANAAAGIDIGFSIGICNNNNYNNNNNNNNYNSNNKYKNRSSSSILRRNTSIVAATPKSHLCFPGCYSGIANSNSKTNHPTCQMACSFGSSKEEKAGVGGVFQLPSGALLKLNKGDITRWSVDGTSDAIVNPANEKMLGGGGADGAIHRAAGPELLEACYKVPEVQPEVRCPTGQARITPGFKLPASHVIHTVGPVYNPDSNPKASLTNAYRNSLAVAKGNNILYIAFPAISCGVFGYPYDEAATVAISTVKEFADNLKEVHFVLFSDEIYDVWLKKAEELLQS